MSKIKLKKNGLYKEIISFPHSHQPDPFRDLKTARFVYSFRVLVALQDFT